jgi:putative SOS response-associated peptidase YedK
MCGRYALTRTELLEELFEFSFTGHQIIPRINIAPTTQIPVIRLREDGQYFLTSACSRAAISSSSLGERELAFMRSLELMAASTFVQIPQLNNNYANIQKRPQTKRSFDETRSA